MTTFSNPKIIMKNKKIIIANPKTPTKKIKLFNGVSMGSFFT